MSATNRGSVRREADFYATPLPTVHSFLHNYNDIKNSDRILEPSAGNGNIVSALRDVGYDNHITAVEIREEERENLARSGADSVYIEDFLRLDSTTVGGA